MINIIICEGKKSERVILNDYINTFFIITILNTISKSLKMEAIY